jgi:hypothetical protein
MRGAALLQSAATCALLLLGGAVPAQPTWRCGPDGRVYQQEPCPGGRAVDVADPRSSAQRRAAMDAARNDARLAERLERERRSRDSAARPAGAAGFNARPAPAAAPASAPPKPQAYRVPGEPRPKKAARRAPG